MERIKRQERVAGEEMSGGRGDKRRNNRTGVWRSKEEREHDS